MAENDKYVYALLGIVSIVVIVGLLSTVDKSSRQENILGLAGEILPPDAAVEILLGQTINADDKLHAITLDYVLPEDGSKTTAVILTIGDKRTPRISVLEDVTVNGVHVAVDAVFTKSARLVLSSGAQDTLPITPEYATADTLDLGTEKTYYPSTGTYRFASQPATVKIEEITPISSEATVKLSINKEPAMILKVGETAKFEPFVITINDIYRGQPTSAVAFYLSYDMIACINVDASQTKTCRGNNYCCNSQCVVMNCSKQPNGPVNTCGDRTMYCCNGEFSLEACK